MNKTVQKTPEPIWIDCRTCCVSTRHEQMFELNSSSDEEDGEEDHLWQTLRCLGCHSVTFSHLVIDYYDMHENEQGEVLYGRTRRMYPASIRGHRPLTHTHHLPDLIKKIYLQTLKAYSENAMVLASIGLRACIEAVCTELELPGRGLDSRIDKLEKAGYVSKGDQKRLHAIRFLGNDAAHEIKEPRPSDMRVALEIIESMLNSIFIMDMKAHRLETVVDTFEEFDVLLRICIRKIPANHPPSNLRNILGKRSRAIGDNLKEFEDQLVQYIQDKNPPYIKLGTSKMVNGKPVQMFEIDRSALPTPNDLRSLAALAAN